MTEKPKNDKQAAFAGIALILLILYAGFFLLPSLDNIDKESKNLISSKKNRVKLKQLLEEYKNSASDTNQDKKFDGSLSAFVEKKAKDYGFTIAYIRPYGRKSEGVEIKIDEMTGDKLLQFTYEMENSGITVSRLNARDFSGNGVWVVKLNLEKG